MGEGLKYREHSEIQIASIQGPPVRARAQDFIERAGELLINTLRRKVRAQDKVQIQHTCNV